MTYVERCGYCGEAFAHTGRHAYLCGCRHRATMERWRRYVAGQITLAELRQGARLK